MYVHVCSYNLLFVYLIQSQYNKAFFIKYFVLFLFLFIFLIFIIFVLQRDEPCYTNQKVQLSRLIKLLHLIECSHKKSKAALSLLQVGFL